MAVDAANRTETSTAKASAKLMSYFMGKNKMSIILHSRKALQNPTHIMERNLVRQKKLDPFKMWRVIYIFLEKSRYVTGCDVKSVNCG